MSTTKTAISIDTKTYKKVTRLTRRLHISRSRFFTQAALYMIERDENLDLLKRINEAWEGTTGKEDDAARLPREKNYARKKVVERW